MNIIDRRFPTSMEIANFCSPQLRALHPFLHYRKTGVWTTIDSLQSMFNFVGVDAVFTKKSDDASLFDFVDIEMINRRNADQSAIYAKTSRLSSMTWNQICSRVGSGVEELIIYLNRLRRAHACRLWNLTECPLQTLVILSSCRMILTWIEEMFVVNCPKISRLIVSFEMVALGSIWDGRIRWYEV
jgi:hypothetical protein